MNLGTMTMIYVAILPIVIAVGLIMVLMVWKKKGSYRVFFPAGIIVVFVSIVLMVIYSILQRISIFWLLFNIPMLLLGIIYLMVGLARFQMNWMRFIMVVIGILIAQLAIWGILMWGMAGQDELMALSVVFVFVSAALSIGAVVWPAKRGRQDLEKEAEIEMTLVDPRHSRHADCAADHGIQVVERIVQELDDIFPSMGETTGIFS